jgi:hypothetical protein
MTALTAFYSPIPDWQVFDDNGAPGSGFKLYTYEAGSTTPLATYTTPVGNTANANPVIFNSAGRATICLSNALAYKFILTDANDAVIWTKDNINGGGTGSGGVFKTVETIAALKALNSGVADFVAVQGYYVQNDGGGGLFFWDSNNGTSQDNGVYFYGADNPAGCNTGRYVRLASQNADVNIRWFGAKDAATDNNSYIAAAEYYASSQTPALALYIPAGIFMVETFSSVTSKIKFGTGGVLSWTAYINPVIIPVIDDIPRLNYHFDCPVNYPPFFPAGTKVQASWFSSAAIGSGTTDDTAAFYKALGSLTSGGTLYVPEALSSYIVSYLGYDTPKICMRVYANTTIIGEGASSLFKVKTNSNGTGGYVFGTSTADGVLSNIVIDNIAIDANAAGQTGVTANSGAIIANLATSSIRNCTIKNCFGDAIYLGNNNLTSTNVTIRNNLFVNNAVDHTTMMGHIRIVNGTYIDIVNNRIEDMTPVAGFGIGIMGDATEATLHHINIDGNKLIGCNILHKPLGTDVMYDSEIKNNSIDLKIVVGYGSPDAIHLWGCTGRIKVSNNEIYTNPTRGGINIEPA